MASAVRPYIVLTRPANVVTSVADGWAGAAIAGVSLATDCMQVLRLGVLSAFLYAGGIVFNDFFDRTLDAEERPERPIPSGQVPPINAAIFGAAMLVTAVAVAFVLGAQTGLLACGVVFCALTYDKFAKHNAVAGPLFMGLARGLNLLIGISLSAEALGTYYWAGLIPLLFIASVTLASREENRGENTLALKGAVFLDLIVGLILLYLILSVSVQWWYALALGLLWLMTVTMAKLKAIRKNTPDNIRRAVKTGVLSLIVLDATYALIFDQYTFAVLILFLLPLSLVLARKFAVT